MIAWPNTVLLTVAEQRVRWEPAAGRVQHFVFTSSTAVYRRSFAQPVRETSRTHDAADSDPRKAYGVGKHRHTPEIDQELALLGAPVATTFVPHLVPLDEGELVERYHDAARGRQLDPVARFHLGNGARLERLNWLGDTSDKGMREAARVADEHGDPGSVDLLSKCVQVHEKHEWWARDILHCSDGLR